MTSLPAATVGAAPLLPSEPNRPKHRLIICNDGTWNSPGQTDRGRPAPTNVVRMARMLDDDSDQLRAPAVTTPGNAPAVQKVFYDQGVGTGNFADQIVPGMPLNWLRRPVRSLYLWAQNIHQSAGTRILPFVPAAIMRLCRRLDAVIGGATGAGLVENVYDSYQFLVDNYYDGDEIFLFGFSRGAYTTRSVAGMLHKVGLVRREECRETVLARQAGNPGPWRVPTCLMLRQLPCPACERNRQRIHRMHELFQDSKEKSRDHHHAARQTAEAEATAQTGRPVAGTLTADAARAVQQTLAGHAAAAKATLKDERLAYAGRVPIKYIGVWDTVGALGVPKRLLLFPKRHDRYAFLDTALNDDVQYAYHALALDERRDVFRPTVWAARPEARNKWGETLAPPHQVWFAGVHSNVGGGYDDTGLSDISLRWMMHWATERGLRFQKQYHGRIFPDHYGELRNPIDGLLGHVAYKAVPRFPWTGAPYPDGRPKVHHSVFRKQRRGLLTYGPTLPPNQEYDICDDEPRHDG